MFAPTADVSHCQAICEKFPDVFERLLGNHLRDIEQEISLLDPNTIIQNYCQYQSNKYKLDVVHE